MVSNHFKILLRFFSALAQPEFITLIETIIKNEREKGKKKKPKTTTTKKKA